MKSKVYFANLHIEEFEDNLISKIKRLFDKAEFKKLISPKDLTAVKVHFGEKGNTSFVSPWYVRAIVDKIIEAGGDPFITDTTTLYSGPRNNAVGHLNVAIEHGFSPSVVNAPIMIADGLRGRDFIEVDISKKHFKSVKIATDIYHADSMIVSSHFKGHIMAGFGGAIKNLAMGCASVAGKREQHSVRPVVDKDLCVGCGICVEVCPVQTIELVDGKSVIHSENCIGCGECIQNCPEKAITMDWETEIPEFVERMTEYAYGAWNIKKEKIGFFNFLINITPDCDCFGVSNEYIVRDIGFLASVDPVAIDKASYDMVNNQLGLKDTQLKSNLKPGEDKFKGVHESTQGELQFIYGEKIGLGSQNYEIIKI